MQLTTFEEFRELAQRGTFVPVCKEIVAANPKIVADVKAGKQQAVGALVGQAKKRNPNTNPNDVRRICLELIEKM